MGRFQEGLAIPGGKRGQYRIDQSPRIPEVEPQHFCENVGASWLLGFQDRLPGRGIDGRERWLFVIHVVEPFGSPFARMCLERRFQ